METENDLYKKLAKHLDRLPGGYPATESGVEMCILRRLVTPQDAELALHLTLIPEEARVIAYRAGLPIAEAHQRLEDMASRGLNYSIHHRERPPEEADPQGGRGQEGGAQEESQPELTSRGDSLVGRPRLGLIP